MESFQRYAKEEAGKVWELYQAGIVRGMYFRTDRDEAILVLESTSLEEARQTLHELPFVREKLIDFDLVPLKAYPGFERLFASE